MVEIDSISFAYSRTSRNILDEVSFDIQKNRCIAILGNNGAGKSTLLKSINRICPVQEGSVCVEQENVFSMTRNERARTIAYVPQHTGSVDMTVFDAVLLGRKPYIKWNATSDDRAIVWEIMQKMNLAEMSLRNISELSGGEVQKVMLARALAQEPKLLLLDEPTSNLDPRNQHEVLQIVKAIAAEHNTCVAIIIHDLNLAIRYCDRFVLLKDARVFAYGGEETITPENLEEVYGIQVDIIDHAGIPLIVPYPAKQVGPINSTNNKQLCRSTV